MCQHLSTGHTCTTTSLEVGGLLDQVMYSLKGIDSFFYTTCDRKDVVYCHVLNKTPHDILV